MLRNASLRCAKTHVGMKVWSWMGQKVDLVVLYRESPTWQVARHVLYAPREVGRELNPRPLDGNEFNQSIIGGKG